jgi:hypothetical protein
MQELFEEEKLLLLETVSFQFVESETNRVASDLLNA